ncbi:hypothetical protein AXF42_Ash019759 [Apostasia shenzhenica]|uniref:Uncharacterized protein n=1 Tax=Apostasia shenzhenica TaxID=1088818 RepID=A0A2H9ZRU3_9ASPA|nr:hypothetical protein AXF42_Ash019759 [Apostasia shenzhenica]
MDSKLETILTTLMARTYCQDDIKIKLDEMSDRVARIEVEQCTHTSEIKVNQPRREPRLVPIAPIPTLIVRPIETIGDQSSLFMKEVLNEFSTETFILPEALKLNSLPISIYIADPSLAEEYKKYEDEIHEEDSYMIEVESQVEKIVIKQSYKEERIIDAIETTKSSYCSDNTIDHIEMIICHGRSKVNSSGTRSPAPSLRLLRSLAPIGAPPTSAYASPRAGARARLLACPPTRTKSARTRDCPRAPPVLLPACPHAYPYARLPVCAPLPEACQHRSALPGARQRRSATARSPTALCRPATPCPHLPASTLPVPVALVALARLPARLPHSAARPHAHARACLRALVCAPPAPARVSVARAPACAYARAPFALYLRTILDHDLREERSPGTPTSALRTCGVPIEERYGVV